MEDYSNSSALAMELLQSCAKPSKMKPRPNDRYFADDNFNETNGVYVLIWEFLLTWFNWNYDMDK